MIVLVRCPHTFGHGMYGFWIAFITSERKCPWCQAEVLQSWALKLMQKKKGLKWHFQTTCSVRMLTGGSTTIVQMEMNTINNTRGLHGP